MHRTTGDNYALDANGNRVFTEGPPPTTVDAGILNSIQEEIANAIEASGQTLYDTPGSDLNNQLALAIQKVAAYDSIVYSQETFNAIWERVGANEYQILDTIGSVYFKAYFGGYNMSGPNSPLSGGDTWGRFKTNNCTFIMCDGGNFFQMGDTPSYWSITTSNTVVYNMDVRGVGAVAAAITKSIYVEAGATYGKFLFCNVQNRISNTTHNIYSSGTSTVTFLQCKTTTCESSGIIRAFYDCSNLIGCRAQSIASTANYAQGFSSCRQVTSCMANTIFADGNYAAGFYNCTQVAGSYAYSISSATNPAYGFLSSKRISSCTADHVIGTAHSSFGFSSCGTLGACTAYDIRTDSNNASYKAVGFQDCDQLSACTADTIAASAANAYAYGFDTCTHMSSSCYATNVTSITAGRDIDFYSCSESPFKSPNSDDITYTAYGSGTTTMTTWTAPKDGHIYGFFYNSNATGGPICYVKEGGYATNQTDADLLVHAYGTNISAGGSFAMPVKAGLTYYFNKSNNTAIYLTLRFMPYGTTT